MIPQSSASIQTTEQMYTVEGGMVLHTTKNPYGHIVLPHGTYTQAEIISFIMEYGDSIMIRGVMDLIAKGSATATLPDGSTVTITAQEGLQKNALSTPIENRPRCKLGSPLSGSGQEWRLVRHLIRL